MDNKTNNISNMNNTNIKKNFVNLFCQLTKICKETNEEINKNYKKGKKDAYEEIYQYFNKQDKQLSVNSLIMFLQEKIDKTKNIIKNKKDFEDDIKPIFEINSFDIGNIKKNDLQEEMYNFNSPKPEILIPNKRKKN